MESGSRLVPGPADDSEVVLARESAARAEARAVHAEAEAARLGNLQAITSAVLGHLALDDLLNELLTRIRVALSTDTAAVLLLNDDATALVARAARGLEEEVEQGSTIPLGKGFGAASPPSDGRSSSMT